MITSKSLILYPKKIGTGIFTNIYMFDKSDFENFIKFLKSKILEIIMGFRLNL